MYSKSVATAKHHYELTSYLICLALICTVLTWPVLLLVNKVFSHEYLFFVFGVTQLGFWHMFALLILTSLVTSMMFWLFVAFKS